MLDNNFERDSRSERDRSNRPADDLGAVGDREVPLAPVATSDMVNRWLDGEMTDPSKLSADAARSVEFWRRLGEETDKRRRMVTPAHLPAAIMAALPPVATPRGQATPWHRQETKLSNALLFGGALGLVALGAIIARILG
jgi:hypothetical protein